MLPHRRGQHRVGSADAAEELRRGAAGGSLLARTRPTRFSTHCLPSQPRQLCFGVAWPESGHQQPHRSVKERGPVQTCATRTDLLARSASLSHARLSARRWALQGPRSTA
jgi:hypothetical protein